jgi:hypothetical protein
MEHVQAAVTSLTPMTGTLGTKVTMTRRRFARPPADALPARLSVLPLGNSRPRRPRALLCRPGLVQAAPMTMGEVQKVDA